MNNPLCIAICTQLFFLVILTVEPCNALNAIGGLVVDGGRDFTSIEDFIALLMTSPFAFSRFIYESDSVKKRDVYAMKLCMPRNM